MSGVPPQYWQLRRSPPERRCLRGVLGKNVATWKLAASRGGTGVERVLVVGSRHQYALRPPFRPLGLFLTFFSVQTTYCLQY